MTFGAFSPRKSPEDFKELRGAYEEGIAALIESRKQSELYSHDKDFDRISGIQRLEP